MDILGFIGGVGPESTIDYYRWLITLYREQHPDGSYPRVIINSIDLSRVVRFIEAGDLPGLTAHLVREVARLAAAGATVGLITANTPHIVFDGVRREAAIPLVSIVEATCEEAQRLGLSRVGLIGTRFTMQGRFYPEVFHRAGMSLVVPPPEEQVWIHDKYMNELVKGQFLPATRDRLLEIVDRLRVGEGIEGLILGGTELPLILRGAPDGGIPFLDTAKIHVKRALAQVSL